MFETYILFSKKHTRTYVGFSSNFPVRLTEHNSGKVKATAPYRPWELFYKEQCIDMGTAKKRERYWKSGATPCSA